MLEELPRQRFLEERGTTSEKRRKIGKIPRFQGSALETQRGRDKIRRTEAASETHVPGAFYAVRGPERMGPDSSEPNETINNSWREEEGNSGEVGELTRRRKGQAEGENTPGDFRDRVKIIARLFKHLTWPASFSPLSRHVDFSSHPLCRAFSASSSWSLPPIFLISRGDDFDSRNL